MIKARTGLLLDLLTALGAAWWIEKFIKVEWAYPYCSVLDDGEAAAVFGFPLPYEQVFIAGSASSNFIPWLYVFNLAVITGGIYFLLRPLSVRLGEWKPWFRNISFGAAATFLLVTAVALESFVISIGVWSPVSSFSDYLRYSELRPVKVHVGSGKPRNCTASPFWFPDKRARSTIESKP